MIRRSAGLRRSLLVAILSIASPAVTVGAAALAAGERTVDREKEMQAREAFAAGRFDEALTLFAKLYAETLHPVYLRNIGRCHQKMRQPDQAIDSFRDYLAKSPKLSRAEQAEIDSYIKEMQALKAAQASAAPATGSPPAGAETAESAGRAATGGGAAAGAGGQAATGGGASVSLAVQPPRDDAAVTGPTTLRNDPGANEDASESPVYTRWWFWTGIGAVVAGGVVAAVLLSGGTDRPACPTTCVTGMSGLIGGQQ